VPVTVQKRGNKWTIIEPESGRVVGTSDTEAKARASARARNRAWAQKQRGAMVEGRVKRTIYWQEALHPRDRLGKFTHVLKQLKGMRHGSVVTTPGGEYVSYKFGRYRLHEKGGRVTMKSRDPWKIAKAVGSGFKRATFEYDTEPPTLIPLATRKRIGVSSGF